MPGTFSHSITILLNTALALRQAIWRKEDARWKVCGIPEALYTDNGSATTQLETLDRDAVRFGDGEPVNGQDFGLAYAVDSFWRLEWVESDFAAVLGFITKNFLH